MPYLNIDEVETALSVATSAPYASFTQLITLPDLTWEGRQCHAIKIANGRYPGRPGVYFLGGLHAREWGSSDILVNFVEQLEKAYLANIDLIFGGTSFSASDIQTIVDTLDIFVFPQANPDGRHYSMTADAWWRKNRRILPPNSSSGSCVGVDLNRNYDFLWDFPTYFNSSAPVSTSTDPCDYQYYHGPTAFSEPESKNAKWIFDAFTNIRFFIDLHSYGEDILYSWGDDDNQTANPSMNFQNPAYNGLRGIIDAPGRPSLDASAYKEYIPSSDLSLAIDLANTMRDGIQAVRGTSYTVKSSANLYPTAGASDDYSYSRHYIDSTKLKVIAYTIEWGKTPIFQPPYIEMQNIIQEVTAGLLAFCLRTSPRGPYFEFERYCTEGDCIIRSPYTRAIILEPIDWIDTDITVFSKGRVNGLVLSKEDQVKRITVTPGTIFERYPGKTQVLQEFDIQESENGKGFQELEGCIAAIENGEVIKAIILKGNKIFGIISGQQEFTTRR